MKNILHITMTQRGEKKKGEKKGKKKEREPDQNKLSKHILIAKGKIMMIE